MTLTELRALVAAGPVATTPKLRGDWTSRRFDPATEFPRDVASLFRGESWTQHRNALGPVETTAEIDDGDLEAKSRPKDVSWPSFVPTLSEAEVLGEVRAEVGDLLDMTVLYTRGEDVRARFAEMRK